jgi:hypothetical protein
MFSVYLIDCTQAFHEMKPIINQNQISRRTFVQKSSFLAAGTAMSPKMVFGYKESALRRSAMGVATSSYANRWRAGDTSKKLPGFENALQLLMHCESIGASGVQVGSRNWSDVEKFVISGKQRTYTWKALFDCLKMKQTLTGLPVKPSIQRKLEPLSCVPLV